MRIVVLGAVLLPVFAALVVGAMALESHASLTVDPAALARVGLPFGGGTIERVTVVSGPHSSRVPVLTRGKQIWPTGSIPVHRAVTVEAVIKRPGWLGWLTGSTERVRLTLTTPSASLRSHYLTLRQGSALELSFKQPIRVIEYGQGGHLTRHVLATPRSKVKLNTPGPAGTFSVAAAPRTWERPKSTLVSWFPAGTSASAVATPAPGTTITPHQKIMLTFSQPVKRALGSSMPAVSPATQGTWHTLNAHTIMFEPAGYGYGLGAKVKVALPSGVRLVGGRETGTSDGGTWTVPGGSPLRLQQLLSILGYLPFTFDYARSGVQRTPEAQEQAAVAPPAGHFHWRWSNVPGALRSFWSPGQVGVMTTGALMAFENDHAITTDGLPGPAVWKALIQAAIDGRRSSFGYTFVEVSLSGQHLDLWHNGHSVLTTAVNTGIPSAPTASGTYPVYEHLSVTTMSGTNPDGSHYSDPGIQFVSYFNGGDALHAFTRAQYGFPQSLGCVEMALGPAGQVWPYTPIGTLVHVA